MTGPVAPAVAWRWPAALLGLAAALPAALVVLFGDPAQGIALAAGVLPGAAIGVPGPRRARIMIVVLGAVVAAGILLGSALATRPVLAVAGIVALAIGACLVAARIRFGRVLLALALPMVGVGFSYPGIAAGAPLAGLMFLGSVWVWLVSLAWPPRPAARTPPPTPVDSGSLDYGIRLGLAAGIAAGIGFAAGAQHVGWACAACLLVMRPLPDMVRLRGLDRLLDIVVGSLVATLVVRYAATPVVLAGTVLVTITAMAATRGSRRYLTPAFTTCIVFLMLLYGSPQDAQHRFNERLAETALGVGLALLFGVALPWLASRRRRDRAAPPAG